MPDIPRVNYRDFFHTATGNLPYDWQRRLAEDPACRSRLIDIPTGLGKTAGVVLAWLWNYLNSKSSISNLQSSIPTPWPRRLVYCLPMRTLVEQTESEVETWLFNLVKKYPDDETLRWLTGTENLPQSEISNLQSSIKTSGRSPIVLMGGEDLDPAKRDWDLHPERPAILIGTQDMLLSRALNRGYGMSRYRWPMHFGLLNNDCLWVMDEVQLMGAGLATTTQLEGFRSQKDLGSHNCRSWWMSATIRPDWMKTVDLPHKLLSAEPLRLNPAEKDQGRVQALRSAPKALHASGIASGDKNMKDITRYIADHRSASGLNLAVFNTVKRARAAQDALRKALPKDAPLPLLLHSHFRPRDRESVLAAVREAPPGQVVVSTQVIEAGVDLSAHTLFTELAPWSSLVQRFGRCNRWLIDDEPHFADSRIHWFDLDAEKEAAPYEAEQLAAARERLSTLDQGPRNAAIQSLEAIESPDADRPRFRHVLRRKDLVELFDTTPDLTGNDIDIDRFVRDADRSNVHFFWRDWDGKAPNGDDVRPPESVPAREELSPAGIDEAAELLKRLQKTGHYAWTWDFVEKQWAPFDPYRIHPGIIILLHAADGGYDPAVGFDSKATKPVTPVPIPDLPPPPEANEDDPDSASNAWQSIAQHTDAVCEELKEILQDLNAPFHPEITDALTIAARWHDWGKAHPSFQNRIKEERESEKTAAIDGEPVAKAPADAWNRARKYPPRDPAVSSPIRRHFRHELASALAILNPETPLAPADGDRDLAAYLAAAHHGKIRLAIRSLPDESQPGDNRRFARGVWDEDFLPATSLGQGVTAPETKLSLEPMEMGLGEEAPFAGLPSWTDRMLAVLENLGPFRLAYLETLLRAADGRGSRKCEVPADKRQESNRSGASIPEHPRKTLRSG